MTTNRKNKLCLDIDPFLKMPRHVLIFQNSKTTDLKVEILLMPSSWGNNYSMIGANMTDEELLFQGVLRLICSNLMLIIFKDCLNLSVQMNQL